MKNYLPIALLTFACSLTALIMQNEPKTRQFPLPLDQDQIVSSNLIFRMSQSGDSMGYSKISFTVGQEQILVEEEAKVSSSFSMEESMRSYLNKESLEMDSVIVTGAANGKAFYGNATFEDGRIQASSDYTLLFSRNSVQIDSTMENTVVERLASLFLFPPAIDFDKSIEFKYPQFSTLDGGFRTVTIAKTTDQVVTVPAGTYDTYKLELTGGAAQQIFYVSKSTPRKIVRIEFKDNNWVYELL